jgi:multicomponent Na+:H+ antiporter subunit E
MDAAVTEHRLSWGHYVLAFATSLLLWVLLTGSLRADELVAGVVVALAVTVVSGPRLAILSGVRLELAAPWHLARYLGHFLVALVRANLDVARRVLAPSLPLRPAVVEVATALRSPLGRLILANSITLTPGTLTVDVQGDRLLVHWIDCPPDADLEASTRAIAASFERHIQGFLR